MDGEETMVAERLKTASYAITHASNIKKLDDFQNPQDMNKYEYADFKAQLKEVAQTLDVTYAYFLRKAGDSAQYIIDNDYTDETVGLNTPPVPFSKSKGAETCFFGETYATRIGEYTEGWEGLLSAFTPVFDERGNVIYCTGVDLADVKYSSSRNIVWLSYILLAIGMIFLISGIVIIYKTQKSYSVSLECLVEHKTKDLVEIRDSMIKVIANLVEYKDDVTGGHIGRTSDFIMKFLHVLKKEDKYKVHFDNWDLKLLVLSSQLHDVGKIAISDSVLKKQGKLTSEEFELMKLHTLIGSEIISKIQSTTNDNDFLRYAKIFAEYHHEKWDGSGYPNCLAAEEIPIEARIMAIADVYDALISVRPYKRAFSHEDAVQIMVKDKGTHFDPNLLDIFERNHKQFVG